VIAVHRVAAAGEVPVDPAVLRTQEEKISLASPLKLMAALSPRLRPCGEDHIQDDPIPAL